MAAPVSFRVQVTPRIGVPDRGSDHGVPVHLSQSEMSRYDETQQHEYSPQQWEARGEDLPIRCLSCGWALEFLGEAPAA